MDGLLPRTRIVAVLAGLALAAACANPSSQLAAHGGDGGATGAGGGAAGGGDSAGHPSAGHSGAAGAGGGLQVDGGGDAMGDVVIPPDGPPTDVAPDIFTDPDGPPELRFLHGLADVSTVRVCIVPWKDGAAVPGGATAPSGDVPYGGMISLAAGVADQVRVVLLTGPDAPGSCESLLAAPPSGVRVVALDVIPAGTLTQPRSLLMVAVGCLGGVALSDPLTVCGTAGVPPKSDAGADAGATPDLSTAQLVLAEVSRLAPPSDRVGLQVMHASATLGGLVVRTIPEGGQAPVTVAQGLGIGAIAPHPPAALSKDVAFGIVAEQAQIGVADASGDVLVAGVADGLAAASIPIADLAPGNGFVAVVIGPHPSPSDAGTGGNPARVAWMRQPLLGP